MGVIWDIEYDLRRFHESQWPAHIEGAFMRSAILFSSYYMVYLPAGVESLERNRLTDSTIKSLELIQERLNITSEIFAAQVDRISQVVAESISSTKYSASVWPEQRNSC